MVLGTFSLFPVERVPRSLLGEAGRRTGGYGGRSGALLKG
jgi:hypothetical protein